MSKPKKTPDNEWPPRFNDVELWRTGDRYFMVADRCDLLAVAGSKEKARKAMESGELEIVARVTNKRIREAIMRASIKRGVLV